MLALTAGAAVALGLAVTTGPAASASARAATPAAPLHTYHVAPNGTDTSGSCTANTASNAFPTIADGLACAVNGDAISLAPTGATPYQGFGTVSQNITISAASGANARTVTVDATASASLTVAAGATVTVTGVTIDGSNAASPDVTNDGTLTLTRDAITDNQGFGGILNSGASLTLDASTVSGNINGGSAGGGGISSGGSGAALTVNNSTIAGNSSPGTASGGVAVSPGTSATFVNSTIAGNTSSDAAGGLRAEFGATATLSNTLIAGNAGSASFPDCDGILTDGPGGHNLIGNATGCTGLTNGANGDQVNASAGLLSLANNGGPTNTVAVVAGSPAVGAGSPATCAQAPISGKDQRGDSRNVAGHGCDIGAYDTGGKTVSLHTYHVAPNGTDTSGSCTANTAQNAFPTIADALACATADGDAISLAPTGATPYAGFGTVSHDITISAASGANARTVAVDETSALTVAAGSDVVLTGVTLSGGSDFSAPDVTNNGVLTLTRDAITNNPVNGGIMNAATGPTNADLTLNATTVSGNVGTEGGGAIDQVGSGAGGVSLQVNNSTIVGNLAGTATGGIDLNRGTGTFVNSTITGNGDASVGGLQVWPTASATLSNTIIAGNTGNSYPDCHGVLTDGPGGHNLIGNATGCTGLTNGVNGDQVGVAAPGLGSLANNGGPTDTAALATGSPAIGAGDATTCEQAPIVDADQRGDSRNATTRGVCDIGAYDTGGA